jgi:hypothetical protein
MAFQNGVITSKSAVARFLVWHRFQQTLARSDTVAETLATNLARDCPDMTRERLQQIGHIFFTSLALQKQDQKSWQTNEQIAFKKARLNFETRKYDDKQKARRASASDDVHHDSANEANSL